ncbi:protein yellow-like [Cloeon dipterum]|uniref:protein yellow-like n=1 Tax=Cloeon dipterum TaxID=197152 RepID=UPI00321F990B
MTPFFVAIFLLGLSSLATAVHFSQVFDWSNGFDYEWPSEANRTRALSDGTFDPETIEPIFMAFFGSVIFFALEKRDGIPVTLVSLPTNSASSEPPKLTPFPSWDMHEFGNCNKIEEARGLQVDSVGRLCTACRRIHGRVRTEKGPT